MMKIKAVLSAGLLLTLSISTITGLMLFVWKGGMIWAIPRIFITDIHSWSSIIMAAIGVPHFLLNRRIFMVEWRQLSGKSSKEHS